MENRWETVKIGTLGPSKKLLLESRIEVVEASAGKYQEKWRKVEKRIKLFLGGKIERT